MTAHDDPAEVDQLDVATDALVDGDVALRPGTARAALAHRSFRTVWFGAMASSVGTWMQNVVLGAFAYDLTRSTSFVGLVFFAQLGPTLLVAPLGGYLADIVSRRKLLVAAQLEQMAFSFLLALVATGSHPPKAAIVGCVLAVGVGQAINGPAYSSLLPDLVGRADIAGAVSLQSVQMNLSRVVGPAIGGVLYPSAGPAWVFALNGVTYLFAVWSVAVVRLPPRPVDPDGADRGLRRLVSGFTIARRDPLIRRVLTTMTAFSFFSLTFIGLMPVLAADNLGMRPKSAAYGLLYAGFGIGAALGAVSVGTWLAHRSKPRIIRRGFAAFAALLAAFALERVAGAAYPTVFVLGFVYFCVVTSLSTVLQEHLADHVRGRVMALWMMSFGGMVPLGTLALSPLAERTSVTAVALGGAAVALLLAWYCDLEAAGAPGTPPSASGVT
jgi:MFS family permease